MPYLASLLLQLNMTLFGYCFASSLLTLLNYFFTFQRVQSCFIDAYTIIINPNYEKELCCIGIYEHICKDRLCKVQNMNLLGKEVYPLYYIYITHTIPFILWLCFQVSPPQLNSLHPKHITYHHHQHHRHIPQRHFHIALLSLYMYIILIHNVRYIRISGLNKIQLVLMPICLLS